MNVNPKFAILMGIGAVSTASIFVRLSSSSPLVIAAYRMLFASILMGLLGVNNLGNIKNLSRREVIILLVSGIALGGHFGTWTASLFFTSIAASTVLTDSSPIFVTIISWLLLKEKTRLKEFFGIILSLIGVMLIAGSDVSIGAMNNFHGDLLALLSAVFISIY
jgi:drug/metabolite transporter (DMT)-like permease